MSDCPLAAHTVLWPLAAAAVSSVDVIELARSLRPAESAVASSARCSLAARCWTNRLLTTSLSQKSTYAVR